MEQDFESRPRGQSTTRLALSLLLTLGLGTSVGCGDDGSEETVDAGGDGDGDTTPGDGDGDQPLDSGTGDGDGGDAGEQIETDAGSDAGEEPEPPAPLVEKFSSGNALNRAKSDRFLSAVFGPDNLIYASGYITVERTVGATPVFDRVSAVARFKVDGTLDTTFGDLVDESQPTGARTGIATWNTVESAVGKVDASESAKSVAVQSDGKVVVVGTAITKKVPFAGVPKPGSTTGETLDFNSDEIEIFVARFTSNGTPDTTGDHAFSPDDEDGILWMGSPVFYTAVTASASAPNGFALTLAQDDAYDIDVDSKDRIVISTRSKGDGRTDLDRYITRFLKDGAFDNDFGTAGSVAINAPGNRSENARRNEILPGDEIISAGYQVIDDHATQVIARLDASGQFVNSWGTNGLLVFNPFYNSGDPTASGGCEAYGAVRQSTGSFVTIGYGEHVHVAGGAEAIYSVRLSPTGEADADWNDGQGYFELNKLSNAEAVETGAENGRNVITLSDDRLVYVGQGAVGVKADGKKSALIGMLTKDGKADTSFASVGHKGYDFGKTNDQFLGLAESPDGKYVVAAGASVGATADVDNDNAALVIFSIGE